MAHRQYSLNVYLRDDGTLRLTAIYSYTFKVHPRIRIIAFTKTEGGKITTVNLKPDELKAKSKVLEEYIMKLRIHPILGDETWDISPSTYTPEDIKHIKWLKVIESL